MPEERLRADEWEVAPVRFHPEAVAFLRSHHYAKGAANTSTYRHGLYRAEGLMLGELMGVALWIPPTRAAAETVADDWRGVLCLSRLCVHPDAPKNAASYLLGRSMRLINRKAWHTLLTYADTGKGHTGAIYKATNWTSLGPVPAGDTWVDADGVQRGRKRGGGDPLGRRHDCRRVHPPAQRPQDQVRAPSRPIDAPAERVGLP